MRRSLLPCVAVALSAATILHAGCDGEAPAASVVHTIPDGGGASIADSGDAGEGGGAGDAGLDAGDGGLSPVLVGVTASAAGDAPSDAAFAVLTTFAAGARVVVVSRAWRDLTPDSAAGLAAEAQLYGQHGKVVLFNLALVDRAADERPDAIASLAWDDSAARASVEDAIDLALDAFGPSLGFVTFGRDVDAYLAAHTRERGAFAALAGHACDHARAKGPDGLGVGVAFSYLGAADPGLDFSMFLGLGNVAALSLLTGQAGEPVVPSSGVAGLLDGLIAGAAGLPIVLQAVGTPSSADVDSSPEKQALFYDTLFDALGPRRASFALVNAHELHDRGPAACDAAAAHQGEPAGGAFASYTCSLGLFTEDGTEKPAWHSLLGGAATFASP